MSFHLHTLTAKTHCCKPEYHNSTKRYLIQRLWLTHLSNNPGRLKCFSQRCMTRICHDENVLNQFYKATLGHINFPNSPKCFNPIPPRTSPLRDHLCDHPLQSLLRSLLQSLLRSLLRSFMWFILWSYTHPSALFTLKNFTLDPCMSKRHTQVYD